MLKQVMGLFILLFLTLLTPSFAQDSDSLMQVSQQLAAGISADPSPTKALFSDLFLKAVKWEDMNALMKGLYEQHGAVVDIQEQERASSTKADYYFIFKDKQMMPVILVLDAETKIVGLRFGPVKPLSDSFDTVLKDFKKLPGTTSLTVMELEKSPKVIHEYNSDVPLAIGSSFKLYVLGALLEEIQAGRMKWEQLLPLKEEHKSLPSGMLHAWENGSPLTLHSLASLMISLSDNTATDHLLLYLGRDKVEAMLGKMEHTHIKQAKPFLATHEMFFIKADPQKKKGPAYLALDEAGKRSMLKALKQENTEKNRGQLDYDATQPHWIDTIEWFASTRDLCLAMGWLRDNTQSGEAAKGRGVLAINPGLKFDSAKWKYIGYKGGSETGVLNMTYLLQNSAGKWYAFSVSWNNPDAALDENQFFGLMQRSVELLAE